MKKSELKEANEAYRLEIKRLETRLRCMVDRKEADALTVQLQEARAKLEKFAAVNRIASEAYQAGIDLMKNALE